jgi:hypothetical protein
MRHLLLALLLVPAFAFAADAATAVEAKKDAAPAVCAKCAAAMEKCADCAKAKADGKLGCAKCLAAVKDCPDCKKAGEKAAEKPAAE